MDQWLKAQADACPSFWGLTGAYGTEIISSRMLGVPDLRVQSEQAV